ncbi:Sperm-associated antigen 5 [Operophtera brumata]|uniref:Sperm-associated antigen 5 n=1 Tax=Operophtera brumata TaxID=104452 RepID=A0A0L7LDI4_OPEBR|nr:Sperm-associated antigen 5 [Operophtera brumata]
MSVSDYSPTYIKAIKPSKWSQFVGSIEITSKDHSTSDSEESVKKEGFLDFLWKKDCLDRNSASTSSMRVVGATKIEKPISKSLASSPRLDIVKRTHLTRCFELPKRPGEKRRKTSTPLIEDSLVKLFTLFPKRRSSTPSSKTCQKRISELRESGFKTDSENDDVFKKRTKRFVGSKVICNTPDNILITETAPSLERFRRYSSTSDDVFEEYRKSPTIAQFEPMSDKYSLIDYGKLPSAAYEADKTTRRGERVSSQSVYVAGKIVRSGKR